ncbi:hypothetical protein EG68_10535 [Paragonimus skrjabini miyazakii]|uniref:Uncharacterized protein n=1 Tax=Paragonimus skrjabini miyazakii TaxID=59628 RepID=A0A8S9YI85_9TREM|nr:hypothetical protein EG68_10535 [Paragonimus skrjabini miyazakii]
MECYRQQAELFRHRQFEVEESAEREFKVWQEERDHLLYKAEEARVMVEQWCIQLQCRAESNTEKTEDPVLDVLKQMEKWCSSRGKIPCLKRRMIDSLYSSDGGTGSVPASPAVGLARNAMVSPFHGLRSHAQRSTSMEWGSGRSGILSSNAVTGPNSMHYREGSLGLGSGGSHFGSNLRGSAMSLALGTGVGGGSNYSLMVTNRCGRSVSPEVSVRKLSNYPDPTPGFLVRPTSRQDSHDSLSSMGDYTQRSFTLPGKPPVRSAISPARRRFFEDASSAVPGSKPLKTPADDLKTTNEGDKQGNSVDMTTSVKRTSPAPDPVKIDNSPETHRKKGSSQPPPSALPSKLNTTDKSKPASTGLSIADRFAKWSSTGGKSGSKVGQTELVKEQDVTKKNSKKKDDETATKTRGKSPKSPEKSASKKPSGTASVEKSVSSDSSNTKNIINDNNSAPKAEKCESTPSAPKNVKRSGSSSNISPAIMALRQKFATGR